jgi:hypothetical protein
MAHDFNSLFNTTLTWTIVAVLNMFEMFIIMSHEFIMFRKFIVSHKFTMSHNFPMSHKSTLSHKFAMSHRSTIFHKFTISHMSKRLHRFKHIVSQVLLY